MQRSLLRRRPLLAGLLGFLYPGLGHLYLRAWLRAIAWFGLAIITAALVVPEAAINAFQQNGLDGLMAASQTFPMEVTASLLVVRGLNVVDAYLTGLRQERAAAMKAEVGEVAKCPNCGGQLDEEIDFCPWCTVRLEEFEPEEEAEPTDSASSFISR